MPFLRERHGLRQRIKRSLPTTPQITQGPSAINVGDTVADIEWSLDRPCTGEVSYGLTTGYGGTVTAASTAGYHRLHLSSLDASSTYHYKVTGADVNANTYDSGDATFATLAAGGSTATYPSDTAGPIAFSATPTETRPALATALSGAGAQAVSGRETEVVRVSATAGMRHRYSSKAAWNSDQSFLLLDYKSGQRSLLNGSTYAILQANINTGDFFVWSNTNPNRGWAGSGTSIVRYDIQSGSYTTTTVASLTAYSAISWGGGQGSQDNGDQRMAFAWKKASNAIGVGTFNLVSNTVDYELTLGTGTSALSAYIDNCGMSQDGQYLIYQGIDPGTSNWYQGSWVWRLGNASASRMTSLDSHWDAGVDSSGNQVFVIVGSRVETYRLDTLAQQTHLSYWNRGHVSCRNIAYPGWCVVSTTGTSDGGASVTWAGWGEILAVKLDGTGTVKRYGFGHHLYHDESIYALQPQACASPDMSRIIFASEWSNPGSDGGTSGYPYVVGMDAEP